MIFDFTKNITKKLTNWFFIAALVIDLYHQKKWHMSSLRKKPCLIYIFLKIYPIKNHARWFVYCIIKWNEWMNWKVKISCKLYTIFHIKVFGVSISLLACCWRLEVNGRSHNLENYTPHTRQCCFASVSSYEAYLIKNIWEWQFIIKQRLWIFSVINDFSTRRKKFIKIYKFHCKTHIRLVFFISSRNIHHHLNIFE